DSSKSKVRSPRSKSQIKGSQSRLWTLDLGLWTDSWDGTRGQEQVVTTKAPRTPRTPRNANLVSRNFLGALGALYVCFVNQSGCNGGDRSIVPGPVEAVTKRDRRRSRGTSPNSRQSRRLPSSSHLQDGAADSARTAAAGTGP